MILIFLLIFGICNGQNMTKAVLNDLFFFTNRNLFRSSSCSPTQKLHVQADLIWKKSLHHEIRSTPVISDFHGDGTLEIILTGANFVDVLRADGSKDPRFPFMVPEDIQIAADPLLYQTPEGLDEIIVSTFDGHILFLRASGAVNYGRTLRVPPLRVPSSMLGSSTNESQALKEFRGLWQEFLSRPWTTAGKQSFGLFFGQSPAHIPRGPDPLMSGQFDKWKQTAEAGIYLDPHILATPVLDGSRLVVPVSYFLHEDTPAVLNDALIPLAACGLVIFDLMKPLSQPLEILLEPLGKTSNSHAGYVYATPTLVDVNRDGVNEILIGTGAGRLFLKDMEGKDLSGFPISNFGPILSSPVVELSANELFLFVHDALGHVVALTVNGNRIWESALPDFSHSSPVIGDVDGNGQMDLVYVTSIGEMIALEAWTGTRSSIKAGHPSDCTVYGSPLLIPFQDKPGAMIVFTASDGFLYFVDGSTGCHDAVGIGRGSLGMPLAAGISQSLSLEILVATQSGDVFLFDVHTPFHPLTTWTSYGQGRSSHTSHLQKAGIFIDLNHRQTTEFTGSHFVFSFHLVDLTSSSVFNVSVLLGGQLMYSTVRGPGPGLVELPIPPSLHSSKLIIQATNQYGQFFSDSISISFNTKFYRLLKWILILPFSLLIFFILSFLNFQENSQIL